MMTMRNFLAECDWTTGSTELYHWGFRVYPNTKDDFLQLSSLLGEYSIDLKNEGREVRRFYHAVDGEFTVLLEWDNEEERVT